MKKYKIYLKKKEFIIVLISLMTVLFSLSIYGNESRIIDEKDAGEYTIMTDPSIILPKSAIYQNIDIKNILIGNYTIQPSGDILNDISGFAALYNQYDINSINDIRIELNDSQIMSFSDYIIKRQTVDEDTTITQNTVWTKGSSPYYVNGPLTINNGVTLTIEAGVEVLFDKTVRTVHQSGIIVNGQLIVNGTVSDEVVFRPTDLEAEKGAWSGIYVGETGYAYLEHGIIEKAGNRTNAGIYALGDIVLINSAIENNAGNGISAFANVRIEDSVISGHEQYGIDIYSNHKNVDITLKNNTFSHNKQLGRLVYRQGYSKVFDVADNVANQNDFNALILYGEIINDMTLTSVGESIPYFVPNRFTTFDEQDTLFIHEACTLTVDQAIIKMDNTEKFGKKSNIKVDGRLNLIGSPADATVITSILDDNISGNITQSDDTLMLTRSDWEGIKVNENGHITVDYSVIKYGGYNLLGVIESKGMVEVSRSEFSELKKGIYASDGLIIGNTTFDGLDNEAFRLIVRRKNIPLTINNNQFKNMAKYIGQMFFNNAGSSMYYVKDNLSENVKYSGVKLNGNIVYDMPLMTMGENIPYVITNVSYYTAIIPDLRVASNVDMTIADGTVFKFDDAAIGSKKTNFEVAGHVVVNGLENSEVVFTSIHDDSVYGDTNGNGDATLPHQGDWGSIDLLGEVSDDAHLIDYTHVGYGGSTGRDGMVNSIGNVRINHGYFHHSAVSGLYGNGKLILLDSEITDCSDNGLDLDSVAYGFDIKIENNEFYNNGQYAAYAYFNENNEVTSIRNNSGSNNTRNGFGIEGTINHDYQLEIAGENFPYIVNHQFKNRQGTTLTLVPGLTVKFELMAKLSIEGQLIGEGTADGLIDLTSVYDDRVAGDTNNDGDLTIPTSTDWYGVVYYDGSEAFFEYIDSRYAFKNMNLHQINHIRTYSVIDKSAAVEGGIGAYIKPSELGSKVVIYNYTDFTETAIADSESVKRDVQMTDDYISWISGNSAINIHNRSNGDITTIIASSVEAYSVNENYVVWTNALDELHYQVIGSGGVSEGIQDVDKTFRPMITSSYMIYKMNEGSICKETFNDKAYYLLTTKETLKDFDIYNNNVVFLGKDRQENDYNVMAANMNTQAAEMLTANLDYTFYGPRIYRDLILINARSESNDEINILKEGYLPLRMVRGYRVNNSDIADDQLTFTDADLVYLINSNVASTDDLYIDRTINKAGYYRYMDYGKNFKYSIGGKVGASAGIAETSAGISFVNSEGSNIKFALGKNSYDQIDKIGLGREKVQEMGIESKLNVGLTFDKIPNVSIGGDVLSASATGAATGISKGADLYYFNYPSQEASKKIGSLITSSLLSQSTTGLDSPFFGLWGYVANLTTELMSYGMDIINNPSASASDYEKSIANGVRIDNSANFSLLYADLSAEGLVEKGVRKDEGELLYSYTAGESIYKESFGLKGSVEIEIGKIDNDDSFFEGEVGGFGGKVVAGKGTGFGIKIPFPLQYEKQTEVYYRSELHNDLSKAIIEVSMSHPNEDDFIKVYRYIIEDTYDLQNAFNHIPSLNKLNHEDGEAMIWPIVNANSEVAGLIEVLKVANQVKYEVVDVKKLFNNEDNISISTEGIPYEGFKPTLGISYSNTYDDVIEVVVDSGIIVNGDVTEDEKIVFVPVENNFDALLLESLKSVAQIISPITEDFNTVNTTKVANLANSGQIIGVNSLESFDSVTFIRMPVDLETFVGDYNEDINSVEYDGEIFLNGDTEKIIKAPMWIQISDENTVLNRLPEGTKLSINIDESTWQDYYASVTVTEGMNPKFAIYQLDEETNIWERLGGYVDMNNHTIIAEIVNNGQYAIGINQLEPDIKWFKSGGEEIAYTDRFTNGDVITIDIIDTDEVVKNDITVSINDELLETSQWSYNSSTKKIMYSFDDSLSLTQSIKVIYVDAYGNTCYESQVIFGEED